MILDHTGFHVGDFGRSLAFYQAVLSPLGIGIEKQGDKWALFGRGNGGFWIDAFGPPPGAIHVAFAAGNREQVRQFHAAALAAGAKDNGPPGIREQYHPNYYGAFVIDPDGHNIEAVCHRPD